MPKVKKYPDLLAVRLPRGWVRRLEAAAAEEGRSMQDMVRHMCADKLPSKETFLLSPVEAGEEGGEWERTALVEIPETLLPELEAHAEVRCCSVARVVSGILGGWQSAIIDSGGSHSARDFAHGVFMHRWPKYDGEDEMKRAYYAGGSEAR